MSCGHQSLQCQYEFKAKLEANNNIHSKTIYVVPSKDLNAVILSYDPSVALQFIKFMGQIQPTTSGNPNGDLSDEGNMNALFNQYIHIFEGIGKHNSKQVTLHIDLIAVFGLVM